LDLTLVWGICAVSVVMPLIFEAASSDCHHPVWYVEHFCAFLWRIFIMLFSTTRN